MFALVFHEPIVPGADAEVNSIFDSLVKKKVARAEATDDGPAYTLSLDGRRRVASMLS